MLRARDLHKIVGYNAWNSLESHPKTTVSWSPKDHFTHETENPWPLHFKHSHWWKRRSWSKIALHYAWGTTGICECKILHGFQYNIKWIMFHGHLDYFQKPPREGRPNTKPPGDHGTPNVHNPLLYSISSCMRTRMNRNSVKQHLTKGPVTYIWPHTALEGLWPHYTTLEVCWTLSFGLSQSHAHGFGLVGEVTLRACDFAQDYGLLYMDFSMFSSKNVGYHGHLS